MPSTSKRRRERLAAAIINDVHDFKDKEIIDGQQERKKEKMFAR
jgi:hypothetical protein